MEKGDQLPDDEWLWRRVFINQIKPDGSVSPVPFRPDQKTKDFFPLILKDSLTLTEVFLMLHGLLFFEFKLLSPILFPE